MDEPNSRNEIGIEIRSVTKRFGDVVAVDGVCLNVRRGDFFSLLGPSGCGKTTLLRMIAGFETPDAGRLLVNGADVTDVPPHRRPVNLVFQHYALFPHLTVRQNVAFGLRYKHVRRRDEPDRVARMLKMVRLAGLERRYPHELSGGQRQRVALARALALGPDVLLLDEPLGALDQNLRKEMQVELKDLQRTLGVTFVFVTHDQEEALTMSDRVAVMNAGRVEQVGPSAAVFERPATDFVARFMGATNFLTPGLRDPHGDPLLRSIGAGPVMAPVAYVVRPEKLRLRDRPAPPGDRFVSLAVAVEQRIYQGINTVWHVRTDGGVPVTVCQQNDAPADPGAEADLAGGRAFVWFDPAHVVAVRAGPEAPSGVAPGVADVA